MYVATLSTASKYFQKITAQCVLAFLDWVCWKTWGNLPEHLPISFTAIYIDLSHHLYNHTWHRYYNSIPWLSYNSIHWLRYYNSVYWLSYNNFIYWISYYNYYNSIYSEYNLLSYYNSIYFGWVTTCVIATQIWFANYFIVSQTWLSLQHHCNINHV